MWIGWAALRRGRLHGVSLRACTVGLILLSLVSCASVSRRSVSDLPATELAVVGESPIVDERAKFREQFCGTLRQANVAGAEDCETFLWRLADEGRFAVERASARDPVASGADAGGEKHAGRARVLIFGGAFGDCFPPWSTAFAGATAASEEAGFDVEIVPISGRSSSERNAVVVRQKVLATPSQDEPLILVGYSKGAVDVLEALVRYPEAAARVAAVISISGAINGSPLATHYRRLYDDFLRRRKIGSCAPSDSRVLESLDPAVRLRWLSQNPLPRNVRYYSLVTFAFPPRIARVLGHMQRILSKVSPRNDGQMLAEDELIPGSALLGFVNADHWAVAVRMEDRFPFLAHRSVGKHPFPRSVLLESALQYVRRDLRYDLQSRRLKGSPASELHEAIAAVPVHHEVRER